MTAYLLTTFDGDPDDGHAQVLNAEQAMDVLVDFLAGHSEPDGSGIMLRVAGYLAGDPARDLAYINGAPTPEARRSRKAEVFRLIHGGA